MYDAPTTTKRPFQNGLKAIGDLALNKPHGNRVRYMSGCRCVPCRASNSRYETERRAARSRGEWNGIVDAEKARQHLLLLSSRGIGRDTVSEVTGFSASCIDLIRTGKRAGIRAMNEKAILAIDPDAPLNDAMLVSPKETWKRLRWLLRNGFTKKEIARRLGYLAPALQLNKTTITSRNALKVEKLYNLIRFGGQRATKVKGLDNLGSYSYVELCTKCTLSECDDTSPRCLIQIERRKPAASVAAN